MIRLRLGQRWKRERAADGRVAPPMDSIGLELDGVELLRGATEESLPEVLHALIGGLTRLAGGARLAEVSLAEAHLTLVFEQSADELLLHIVRLARPAARLRPPVELSLLELREAVLEAGGQFLEDLRRVAPKLAQTAGVRQLGKDLERLRRKKKWVSGPARAGTGFVERISVGEAPAFTLELKDGSDLLRAFSDADQDGLGSLLCDGGVQLELADLQRPLWKSSGTPFLTVLELVRQGAELLRAIETEEPVLRLELAGVRPALQLDLQKKSVRIAAGEKHAVDPEDFARALFEAGVSFAAHVRARHRRQAKNPYLEELETRCQEGLRHLRPPPTRRQEAPPPRKKRKSPEEAPLAGSSRLRKLRFEQSWEARGPGDEPAVLHVGEKRVVLSTTERLQTWSLEGALEETHVGTAGVAADADGDVLCASAKQVLRFRLGNPSAVWFRDHDGLPLGPVLCHEAETLLTLSEDRSALAFDALTGRELWRISPPRSQRSFLSAHGPRTILGTDAGDVFGLDTRDGQARFRLRAPLPVRSSARFFDSRFVMLLGRGERSVVVFAETDEGKVLASVDLELSHPSPPVPWSGGVLVAGEREGSARVVYVDGQGKVGWQRTFHLGPGPFVVEVADGSPIVVARDGTTVRLSDEGRITWRLGTAGESLLRTLPPVFARGVLLLPGEKVRAVEPKGGRVLAELEAGAGLRHLAADRQLRIYLADEEGHLRVFRLVSHVAVV